MNEIVLIFAALYGGLGVIFGAFGAHLLKEKLTPERMVSFETGVRYQLIHAVVLLVIGMTMALESTLSQFMSWFFVVGTFLFSFSIYGLILSETAGRKIKILGPITPLGGLFLIAGWACLLAVVIA